jgi:CSLREA domain-containing protein
LRIRIRNGVVVALAGLLTLALPAVAGAATITVTSALDENAAAADNGTCTLREAVSATNTNATVDTCGHDGGTGADRIEFQAALADVVLSITATADNANVNGDLDVNAGTGGLTIAGGAGQTVDAAGIDRVLDVNNSSPGPLKLEAIELTGGAAAGGGGLFISAGQVELEDSSIAENTVTGGGGGISLSAGALVLDNSEVRANIANGASASSAGISTGSGTTVDIVNGSAVELNQVQTSTTGNGGGLNGSAAFTISDSTIAQNTATGSGGGINLSGFSSLTVTNSAITDNVAQRLSASGDGGGGGIQASSQAITIDDSVIARNSAGSTQSAPGGGININGPSVPLITDSLIEDNDSTRSGGGIALLNLAGLTLRRSVVSGNEVSDPTADGASGGGIQASGGSAKLIEDSLISGNSTTASDPGLTNRGAGLFVSGSAGFTAKRTTIADNFLVSGAQQGGGAYAFFSSTPNFTNVTFSGNQALGTGGDGGGIFADTSVTLNLSNATFSGNDAADLGDGIFESTGTTTLRSTIVADGCNQAVTDVGGGSFQSATATGACGLPVGAPGFVGGLQSNGGAPIGPASDPAPRPTQAIGFAGSAFDQIEGDCLDHTGAVISEDARGVPRPFDAVPPAPAGCDSGAFELVTCAGLPVDGTDAITGTAAGETLTGTPGADQIYAASGDDTVLGGGGADTICGAEGDDDLQGEADGDRLHGGPGDDALDGGPNAGLGDTADYLDSPSGVNVNLTTGVASGEGADTLQALEGIQGSRLDDVLTGDLGTNSINGGAASSADADLISGGGGSGPDGNDFLSGGPNPGSIDTVTYASRSDAVAVDLVAGQGGETTGPETDTLISFENAIGGSGADDLTGDAGPNSLRGGPGADEVTADAGADQLFLRDGVADTADCGSDNPGDVDTVEADVQGTDTLTNCLAPDLLDFALPPANPNPGTGNPGTVTPTKPKCKKGRKLKKVKGKFKCVKKRKKRR